MVFNDFICSSIFRSLRCSALLVLSFSLSLTLFSGAQAQTASTADESPVLPELSAELAPVIIDGEILFHVRGISAYPASRRAQEIEKRIVRLAADTQFDPATLRIVEQPDASAINAGREQIMAVLDGDAVIDDVTRQVLAQVHVQRMTESIASYRAARTAGALSRGVLYIVLATLVFVAFIWLGLRAIRRLDARLDPHLRSQLQGLETKSFHIVRATQIRSVLRRLLKFALVVACVAVGLWYLQFSLSVLPWTRLAGSRLFAALAEPLSAIGAGLLSIIPDLIFLALLFFVVRYLLRALRILFAGIADGAVQLKSFDADWSWPTYRLVRIVVVAFAIVVAFPYIPGSSSDAFKGVTVFLGIVFSLGSSSVIANIIAGYSISYRRAFKVGDIIKVDDRVGEVIESRLLVTQLRTPKREDVIVPNSLILNSTVVNYSVPARTGQLVLHTTVGIGYETPWRQVEAMLILAAKRTDGLQKDTEPFVLQKSLGDFCVTYELNVFCNDAKKMNALYTALHRNILDVFNEHAVQIMTPAYEGDTPEPKIVPRERWYEAPATPPITNDSATPSVPPARTV